MNSENIRKIFHPFTKIPGVRLFLGGLYRQFIYNPIRKKEIALFQKNALSVLTEFDDILKESNVPYCLFWGSLIGAVREHGFIKHDFDIDVAMWHKDYTPELKQALIDAGFKHKHRFLVDRGISGMEDTFEKSGVAIDIFYFFKDNESQKSYCCSFDYINGEVTWEDCIRKYHTINLYRFFFDLPSQFKYVPFENISLPIPENYDEILRSYYGNNYMIPNPNWPGGEPDENKWNDRMIDYLTFD